MSKMTAIPRLHTGIPNLDALVSGGLPRDSVIVFGGPPGAGKSILSQQIGFHHADPDHRVLFFNTLSEPTAKTLRHLSRFSFFDAAKIESEHVQFVDVGEVWRRNNLEASASLILQHVNELRPSLVVIDSFRVFDDLAKSQKELRKFVYELVINLMTWQTTTLLLGEFGQQDIETNPLFSVVDGLLLMSQREAAGEQQRFLQFVKLRGTPHSREEYPFEISDAGINVFAPRLTMQRKDAAETGPIQRMKTGISKFDDLLGEGIPYGSSLLVGGVAGTGKTVLLLEFLYRGALAGEKGILFSFEETEARLRAAARGIGWDLDREIERGMIEVVNIPQPDIRVEAHLQMMRERVEALQARRVAVDSLSVFLHKVDDPEANRDKVYQLASIIQNARAVGFLATDIAYGSGKISRFGVEETVVDGIVLLTSTEEGFERHRYIEIYKLRNTSHLKGRHSMLIETNGINIFPRYSLNEESQTDVPAISPTERYSTGLASLDRLLDGGVLQKSVTLLSGSTGIGKSTLALQFLLAGAKQGERGLFVAFEEGPEQLQMQAAQMGLPVEEAVGKGLLEVIHPGRRPVRAGQYLSVLRERIETKDLRRLVIDGIGHMLRGIEPDELRELLTRLAHHFRSRGITSLFTLETRHLYESESATDQGFAALADNLILLRYRQGVEPLRPFLRVLKTRGSAHDKGAYAFSVGPGGAQVGKILNENPRKKPGKPPY